jgi:hypothetical protein
MMMYANFICKFTGFTEWKVPSAEESGESEEK